MKTDLPSNLRPNRDKSAIGFFLLCFLSLAAWGVPALAQTAKVTVHLDPATAEIRWSLRGDTHTTKGTFKLKSGTVIFDPATGVAEGELLVDLSTGESGNKKRDATMQNEVLESSKYPEAFFHPTRVTGKLRPDATQTQALTADGSFNIHGADHPLKLDLLVQMESGQATATTHFNVPYVAWGMKNPSGFLLRVSKTVEVDVIAHGTVEAPTAK